MGAHLRSGARGLTERPLQYPAFIVHSLTHAVAALTAAAERGCAIVLLSAPDAGISAGPGWFKALIDAARDAVPAAKFSGIIDCGDDAGAVLGATRAGIETAIFVGRPDVAERLAAIAAAAGTHLLTRRPEAVLDLGDWFFADAETLRRHSAERLASLRPIC
jgi:hypothetical protein